MYKELTEGNVSGQQIADWLGISHKTYRNNPNKQLAKLDPYCDFKRVWGGIIITKVYVKVYDKNLMVKVDKALLKEVHKKHGIISMTGTEEATGYSRHLLSKSRDNLFGKKPLNVDADACGLLGTRKYIWAIKLEGSNNYRALLPEEDSLFNSLIGVTYQHLDPNMIKERSLLLNYCAENNLSAQDYLDLLTAHGLNFFSNVVKKFKEVTALQLVHATNCDINPNNFDLGLDMTMEEYKAYLLNYIKELEETEKAETSKNLKKVGL